MRQRFEQQLNLGILPIKEIKIPTKSRDEMPPTVRALQHIFTTPTLNEKVFTILEEAICKDKKKTGRKGMDLWHIFVLAVVRHATATNWDRLHLMANGDKYVREIMGVHATKFGVEDIEFEYQNILDNVSLITDDMLYKINEVVVEAGHQLIKKKENEVLELSLKTDSYALETNVHFPTDLNLLWDSIRKCFDMIAKLQKIENITGWRKIKHLRKSFKSLFRSTSQQVFRGKNEHQKIVQVKAYLQQAREITGRCQAVVSNSTTQPIEAITIVLALKQFIAYATKFIDQIDRRLLQGAVIPAEEKIYSIFEPHTEWITKGKQNKKVELGHLLLITTDQHQFIVDYKIMEKQKDPSQVTSLKERLEQKLVGNKIKSISLDKGFWSKENLAVLQASSIEEVVLPKRGNYSKADKERESSKSFKKLRNQHSAVESNINMLEHHGLNKCMDKGLDGYKRCVGLSVVAYNLHILGNQLQATDRKKEAQAQRRKERLIQAA